MGNNLKIVHQPELTLQEKFDHTNKQLVEIHVSVVNLGERLIAKDQQLSLLTEKYNKMKEAFEELLEQHCRVVDNSFDIFLDADSEREEFLIKAGLKEQ